MSTRKGRLRNSIIDTSPVRTRKNVSPSRSPARTRKTSPKAKNSSPARSAGKSPSRKSPNRKTPSKFPARKSPSRTTKEPKQTAEVAPQAQKSPSKRPAIKPDASVRLEDMSRKLEIFRNTRSKRIEYSIHDVTTTQNEFVIDKLNGIEPISSISDDIQGLRYRSIDEAIPRRSSRLREFIDKFENSDSQRISKSMSKSISKSLDTYSDEEQSEQSFDREKSKSVTRKLATPLRNSISSLTNATSRWEFGGRLGTGFLILLIPLSVFALLFSCKKACTFNIDLGKTFDVKQWLTLQSFGLIFGLYMIQSIIAITPVFGTKSDKMDGTGMKYCFNAFFSSLMSIISAVLLVYFKIIYRDAILSEFIQMATVSYMFAVILSFWMYVKSKQLDYEELNQYGVTGYSIYDFFIGRELHPHIKNLNVKILISRFSNTTTLILSLLIMVEGIQLHTSELGMISLENYKETLNKVQLKPTLLTFSMMQIVYILYFIIREYKITSTFFWQSEGVGYLQLVSSALYPFYFTIVSKNVADGNLNLSTNILLAASMLFTLGFFIMLVSNDIKHQFRTNPLQPGLAHLNSMPTFHGKKLLVANAWGLLRHPNYAGDILIHVIFALPGILSHRYVAATPGILTILVLLHRAWRDHGRCKKRYGAAWQRYCKRVPSVVLPKII